MTDKNSICNKTKASDRSTWGVRHSTKRVMFLTSSSFLVLNYEGRHFVSYMMLSNFWCVYTLLGNAIRHSVIKDETIISSYYIDIFALRPHHFSSFKNASAVKTHCYSMHLICRVSLISEPRPKENVESRMYCLQSLHQRKCISIYVGLAHNMLHAIIWQWTNGQWNFIS
jgi:hypothetical protein